MIRHVLPVLSTVFLFAPGTGAQGETGRASAAVRANDAFAAGLYGVLRRGNENLFFSPYSIHVALAMTMEGARGSTAEQMARVLHTRDTDSIAGAHAALCDELTPRMLRDYSTRERKKTPAFQLEIANRVWAQEGLTLLAPFRSSLGEQYGSPVAEIDFRRSAEARKAINDWVAGRTKNRIRDIVPENLPAPDTLLALANAIWFKAQWQEAFRDRATRPAPFTTSRGDKVDVPTMHRTGSFRYAETDGVQVCELPYRGGDVTMLVVLPKDAGGLTGLALDAGRLAQWSAATKSRRVAVAFPKFEFTCSYRLEEALRGLGMKLPFTGRADFTGITRDEPLMIGPVLHKAFVAVDEKGTEAAAATVVSMKRGGKPPSTEPVRFTVDRPFLFAIRHRRTGCTLFLGHVVDPRSRS